MSKTKAIPFNHAASHAQGGSDPIEGGGASNHSALSSLAWNDSGHTGTANAIPVFGGGGAAAEVAIGGEGTVLQVVGGVIVWAALSVSLSVLQPDAQSFDLAPMDVISTVTQA